MTTKDKTFKPVIYLSCTKEAATVQYTAVCSYIRKRTDLFSLSDQDCIDDIPLYIDFISGEQSSAPSCISNLYTLIQEHASNEYDCVVLFGLSTLPSSWQGEWILSLLIDHHHFRVLSVLEGYDSSKEKKPVSAFPSHAMLEPPADSPLNPVMEQIYHNSLLREDTGENANNSAFSAYGYLFDPDIPCKEGIPSPITRRKQMGTTFHYGSSHWSFVSILKILQNRTYIGEHIYRFPKLPRHMKQQAEKETPIPSGAVIPHHHPALITEKDFEAAQILLKYKPKQERKPQAEKYSCTPFTNLVFCGACGRPMLHRHKKRFPSSRSAYLCVSAAKHLPDACPCISHPTDDIITAARSSILQECRQADKVRDTIKEGTGSAAYRYASEDIRRRIIEILDLTRSSASEKSETLSSSLPSDSLPEVLSALVEEKQQLIKLFTEENDWLRDFALPEDFVLDRKTAKQLIQRIDVYPDGKTIVTLRDQADKERLLRYL